MRWLCWRRRSPVASGLEVYGSRCPDTYRRTSEPKLRASIGFWMNPSQPTAKLVSRSPSAVMATIGTPLSDGSLLRRSVTS
jgi:hypothetical protein